MKFLFAFTLFTLCSSIELICDFHQHSFETAYTCEVKNLQLITSKDNRTITKVSGSHQFKRCAENVTELNASWKEISYFPLGTLKFFKNLKRIVFHRVNLLEISKEDLKEFGPQLLKLKLSNNPLTTIRLDTFDYTLNLEELNLMGNKLWQVDEGAFDRLKFLKNFYISFNPCTDPDDSAVVFKVLDLIKLTYLKCDEKLRTTTTPRNVVRWW